MQPVASIEERHLIHPTTGKHRATSTSPGNTKTGDRMHNEKIRTLWLHCQQGLPCLSAVAPTLSGASHAPRVKTKIVWIFLLNAMAASSTDDSLNWRSYLTPHTGPRVPDPFRTFLCQPGAVASLLRLLRQLSPHRSCLSEWE